MPDTIDLSFDDVDPQQRADFNSIQQRNEDDSNTNPADNITQFLETTVINTNQNNVENTLSYYAKIELYFLKRKIIRLNKMYSLIKHRYDVQLSEIKMILDNTFDTLVETNATALANDLPSKIADLTSSDAKNVRSYQTSRLTERDKDKQKEIEAKELESDAGRRLTFKLELSSFTYSIWQCKFDEFRKKPNMGQQLYSDKAAEISKSIEQIKNEQIELERIKSLAKKCRTNDQLEVIKSALQLSHNKATQQDVFIEYIAVLNREITALKKMFDDALTAGEFVKKASGLLSHGHKVSAIPVLNVPALNIPAPVVEADNWSMFRSYVYNFVTPSFKHGFVRPILLRKLTVEERYIMEKYNGKKDAITKTIRSYEANKAQLVNSNDCSPDKIKKLEQEYSEALKQQQIYDDLVKKASSYVVKNKEIDANTRKLLEIAAEETYEAFSEKGCSIS